MVFSPSGVVTVSRIRRWFLPTLLLLATIRCGGGDSLTLPDDGLPAAIVQLGGDGQTGVVGQRLTDTLVVQVTDFKDRLVVNQKVVFQAVAGGAGAILIPDTTLTDINGQARSVWVLGTLVGAQRVEARVINPALRTPLKTAFTATAMAGQPDTVFALAGNNQSATAGTTLPTPLTVVVADQFGNPLSGLTVTWSVPPGQGSVSAATTVTSAAGQASVTRTLGPGSGAQTASASVTGVASSPVVFHQTATAGGATSLVIARGNSPPRTAPVGFQDSVVVRLLDANGNGVPNGSITWAPAQGGSVAPSALSQTDANGYAFTFWTFGPAAGPQNVTATAAPSGLQVTISGTATASQPTTIARASGIPASYNATVGQAVSPAPSVKVTDQNGNPVQGVNVDFMVTGGNGQVSNGSVTASRVTILTNASGIATLSSWTLGSVAGANSLEASAFDAANTPLGGSPVGWTATGQAGSAAQLAITSQPSATAQSGVVFGSQPSVQLQDQFGNPVTQNGVIVTAAVAGGGATLRGTLTATTSGGTASFTGLNLFGPVGNYSLVLSAPGLTSATTQSVALSAGPAALLALTTQPSASAQSGVPFAAQPALQVRDSAGNSVAGSFSITATLASGAGALGGTTTVASLANGSAAFTDLSITGASGPRTLSFSAAGLASAVSGTVTVGAGVATQLGIKVQPSASALSGSVFAQQPQVELRDATGNTVPQALVGITAAITGAPAGVTLGGATTVQTSAAGVASFAGLALTGPAGNYSLTFAVTAGATGVSSVASSSIALSAGSGTTLTLTTAPPATGQSGVALAPATVIQLRDGSGNPAPQAGVAVVASISSGAGGTLGGTDTVLTDLAGAATFSNLIVSGPPGAYTIAFNGTGLTGVTAPAATTLSAGPAARLALLTQPAAAAQSGVVFTTQPVLQLQDAAGNPVSQQGTTINATIASGGGTLGGTLPATTGHNGQASYADLLLTGTVGPRTLDFTATGLTKVTSGSILLSAGAPASLAKQVGDNQSGTAGSPVPIDPQVRVTDVSGNPVAGVDVTFAVTAGGGSAASIQQTDAAGLASVTWTLGRTTGPNSLDATAMLAGGPATVSFTATGTAGTAGQLAITTQPSASAASGAVFAQQPAIQLQDLLGNPVTTNGVAITAQSSGALGGNVTVATVNGVATFANLSLAGLTGSYTLTFTGTNLTGVTSNSIALTPGQATGLVVVTQPGTTEQSGVAFAQQPVIQVVDAAGNAVASFGRAVTAAINSGPGGTINPTGRQVSTNANGTASFTTLTLTGPVGSYTLLFSTAGLSADVSSSFALAAGPASQISANSTTSQSATVGTVVAAPPSVLVVDGAGNPVGGVTVSFSVTAGGGSLNGASAVTDPAGVAAVTSWTIGGIVGPNTVTATATGLSGSPVTFNATGIAGSATTIALDLGNNQSATVNTAVVTAPSVKVLDANSNPVGNVSVTFAVASGGGSVTVGSATTNASGIATVGSWTLGQAAGPNTMTAASGTLGGSPVTFTATGTAGVATTIAASAGNGQTATAGTAVATAPQVLVTDGFGNPKSGLSVTFTPLAGSGSVAGGTTTTNASGLATVGSWTLGAAAGTNSLTATATGGGISGNPATFTATGTAGGAASVAANSVTTQTATVGTAVAAPPSVIVRDASNNPVAGATVTFALTAGGGSLVGGLQTTNGSGVATVTSWTLGSTAGSNTATATVSGSGISGNPVSFTATGTAGLAATITLNLGNGQSATVNTAVATAPSVKVTDASGNAVAGTLVTFAVTTGGGTVNPVTAVATNASGIAAVTSWTLGTAAGSNTLSATATGLSGSPVAFTATGTAGVATTLLKNAGDNQSTGAGTAVAIPPQVLATDGFGNPKSGVSVTFAVASGGGTVNPTAAILTNGSGLATVTSWTVGGVAGPNTLTAASAGITTVTFTATGTAGGAGSVAANSLTSQSATVGTAVAAPPSVIVRDALNNPVAGVTVTFAITAGTAGSLAGATQTTDAAGVATVTSWTLDTTARSNTVTATVTGSGITGNPVTFTATGTAGTAAKLIMNRQPSTAPQSGVIFPTTPRVQVADQYNNAVATPSPFVVITASVLTSPGGTPVLTPLTATTISTGLATFTNFTLTGLIGSYTFQFDATAAGFGTVNSNPVTLNPGLATALSITTEPPGSSSSGAVLIPAPAVQLVDGVGNAVSQSGVAITVAVASGPGGSGLTGNIATTSVTGLATFSSLALSGSSGSYTLSFTGTTQPAVASTPIVLGAGGGTKLAIATQPSSSVANATVFPQQPVIQLQDGSSNPVSQPGVSVSVVIISGSGTLGGTTTAVTNGSGQAVFTNLQITGLTGNRTLLFAASGFSTATSNAVNVTVGPPALIAVAAGNGQSAEAGFAVATAPAVVLTDISGQPVPGVSVTFAITSGGGSVSGTPAISNSSGIATLASWTLGTTAGSNSLSATATGGSISGNPVAFTAIGTAGAAATIALNAGNNQTATAGTAVAIAPSVTVADGFGNPKSGVSVTFAVASGGGSVTVGSATTNASGIATVGSWTLGTTAGSNTLTATSGTLGGSPVTFGATGTAGAAAAITGSAGDGQTATVGSPVATAPQVLVTDGFGNPKSGVSVTFAVTGGGGTVVPTSAIVTDVSGHATVGSWTLGTTAGSNTLTATSGTLGGSPVTFTATGVAGSAQSMLLNAGNNQSVTVGTAVTTAPSVIVRDGSSNPVSGVSVTFAVASGGGSVTGASATTNASGIATVGSWTLGTTAGSNTLTATSGTLGGSPVTFTATGVAGSATQLVMVTQPSSGAQSGVVFGQQPSVRLEDQFGNPVGTTGTPVTVAIGSGGGSLGGTATVTTVSGVATFAGLSITGLVGSHTLTFSSTGLTGATSNTITLSTGAAATIVLSAGDGQSTTVNTAVGINPAVLVTDNAGNPVSGVSVTLAVATGGGSVTGGSATTDVNGIATVGGWTLGQTAGSNTLTATSGTLGGSPVTFTATGLADNADHLVFTVQPSNVPAGVSITPAVEVRILDAFGNVVTSATDAVTIALANDPNGVSVLSGTLSMNAASGVASFNALQIDLTGVGFTLSANSGVLAGATSASFDVQ